MEKRGFLGRILDKAVTLPLEIVYSKEKKRIRILIGITLIGFIIRLIAALNLDTFADDMVYASQSAGVLNAGIISTHSNPPLFFYLTDIAYKIFGYTTFASRFWPLICGTALIVVVFLITRKFFDEKTALFSALFVALANFLIRMTFSEQSLVLLFFCFFGIYLGIEYLDNKNRVYLISSAILFGLGLLTKYNAPFFIIAFLVFSAFYLKSKGERVFSKSRVKDLIIFSIIIVLFAMPFLVFNYSLFKEKGIVDVYFSRLIHIDKAQETYQGLAGQENSFFSNIFNPSKYYNYGLVFGSDLILGLFGLLGIGIIIKRKIKMPLIFFLVFLFVPFILQTGGSTLEKHFAFIHLLFSIPAGYALNELLQKIGRREIKIALICLLVLVLAFNIGRVYKTPSDFVHQSATSQLKSYINSNVKSDDLIIFDDRIYSAKAFWMATDNHFLTFQQFPNFYLYNENLSQSKKVSTKVFVVECVTDDCGWGWVSKNQEVNSSSEAILRALTINAQPKIKIMGFEQESGNEFLPNKKEHEVYAVYNVNIALNPSLVKQTNGIQGFYFVPYLYENIRNYLFSYQTDGLIGMLNSLSRYIIWLAVILVFIFIAAVILFL